MTLLVDGCMKIPLFGLRSVSNSRTYSGITSQKPGNAGKTIGKLAGKMLTAAHHSKKG